MLQNIRQMRSSGIFVVLHPLNYRIKHLQIFQLTEMRQGPIFQQIYSRSQNGRLTEAHENPI